LLDVVSGREAVRGERNGRRVRVRLGLGEEREEEEER
jgi:hypothetical protein